MMAPRNVLALILALSLSACGNPSPEAADPPVTAAHYANAEKWINQNITRLATNLFVRPHWIQGEGHRFWYQREVREGHEIVVVDAGTGGKLIAFDHAALAAELTRLGEPQVEATAIAFSDLRFAPGLVHFEFSIEERRYRCARVPVACEKVSAPVVPEGVLASPDGLRGIRTENANIELLDLRTGSRRALTQDGREHYGYGLYYGNWTASYVPRQRAGKPLVPMGSQWSPDSRHVLVTRLDERHVAEYPFLESSPADGSFRPKVHRPRIPLTGEAPAKIEWFVIDVIGGRKVRLDLPYDELLHLHQDWTAVADTWWDTAAGTLFVLAYGDNKSAAFFFEIDLRTGKARTLIEERMTPRMDLNSSPYNAPNVRWLEKSREILWFSQRSGWGHLYLHDGQTGKLKGAVTQGDWLVRDVIEVDEVRRRVYFTASGKEADDPYHRYLYRVNLDGSDLQLLTPEQADHMLMPAGDSVWTAAAPEGYDALSPDGEFVVYNYSRIDAPTRTAIVATAGGTPSVFETADASALYAAGWRNPEAFVVKAADGETDLHGVLYRPPVLGKGRRYPIVDRQYASPLTAVVPHNFAAAMDGPPGRVSAASLSELDFAVVVLDARGTTFRSRAFSHYSEGRLNTNGLEDHVAAIRQLAQKYPWMDVDRVAIDGASYGGFAVFRAMFEFPEFFKVGVSSVGMGSFSSMYPDSHWEAYHGRVRYVNGTSLKTRADERPVNYLDVDSSLQANKLKGRLLITLGELDENVLPGSTLQVIDSLIRADKDFDMYYYPNEAHRFRTAFATRKIWDYLVQHLHGQSPPPYHITSLDPAR